MLDSDHIELVPSHGEVYLWRFALADLEEWGATNGCRYTQVVVQALGKALAEFAVSPDPALRQADLTVWLDERGQHLLLAVSAPVPPLLQTLLERDLREAPGYEGGAPGRIEGLFLSPRFRYDRGRVVEYVLEDHLAGGIGPDSLYGVIPEVHYRVAF